MRPEHLPVPLTRRFFPIPDEIDTRDEGIDVSIFGLSPAESWSTLEDQFRIVILADAGAGKTFEMRAKASDMRASGRRAFFLRIEDLSEGVAPAFEVGTSDEYDSWKSSTAEAWFFLDSIDEAKLEAPVAFEKALKRFAADITTRSTARTYSCRAAHTPGRQSRIARSSNNFSP